MDEEEYTNKYLNLRVLKGIQEYLNSDDKYDNNHNAVYPLILPDELM